MTVLLGCFLALGTNAKVNLFNTVFYAPDALRILCALQLSLDF